MAQNGDGNSLAAENTAVATTSGVTVVPVNPAGVADLTKNEPSCQSAKAVETTDESQKPKDKVPKLGTASERLGMIQEAAKNFQKAGGHIRTGWTDKNGVPTIILAIPWSVIIENEWVLFEEPKAKTDEPVP